MIPRSHHLGLLPHGKSQASGNLLSVNQEIDTSLVDDSSAVNIELPPGSASLHDGMTIHGSNPNRSQRRRCGLTMRFITPEVAPVGEDGARWRPILMQGNDPHHHFPHDPIPRFAARRGSADA
jgi:ectoine hydroxylase-related dioxygenase (phytanoyl-CoA dioxygenase family)